MSLCFVSSFNQRLFESEHQGVVSSVQRIYPEVAFYIGHENSYEKQFERAVPSIPGTKLFDVFETNPDALDFIAASPFSKWRDIEDYWNRNAVFWFRKLLALHYVMREVTQDIIVWLDCDIELHHRFDDTFLNWIENIACASVVREGMAIDTGVIVFNRSQGGVEIFERWLNYYLTGHAFNFRRWDDGFMLTALAQKTKIHGLTPEFGCPVSIFDFLSHAKSPLLEIRDKE